MGLIQRAIEAAGIATISVSRRRDITEKVRPPRALFLRWPYGHPLGEPNNPGQQMTVLTDALRALRDIQEPGTILDLPYRWRRERYTGRGTKI